MMTRESLHPEQRAVFRETARRIVGADRAARAQGRSQNTIGEIERALVAAYCEGRRQLMAVKGGAVTGTTIWLQIPARCRTTLQSLTFWFSKRSGLGREEADRIECFDVAGKPRWRRIGQDGIRDRHSVADGSARPLIGLGLIAACPDAPGIYSLTEAGISFCRDYWARSDVDDPSLPKISLR
jgi:hypothetical protein